MNTRSLCSSRVSVLSVSPYGGGVSSPTSPDTTRRGPSSPRCSQTLDDPGPPLKAKVTGRWVASASSSVYAVTNSSAFGRCPSNLPSVSTSLRSTIRPAVAVYAAPDGSSCALLTRSSAGGASAAFGSSALEADVAADSSSLAEGVVDTAQTLCGERAGR